MKQGDPRAGIGHRGGRFNGGLGFGFFIDDDGNEDISIHGFDLLIRQAKQSGLRKDAL
jgi:cold shock CspA family protein